MVDQHFRLRPSLFVFVILRFGLSYSFCQLVSGLSYVVVARLDEFVLYTLTLRPNYMEYLVNITDISIYYAPFLENLRLVVIIDFEPREKKLMLISCESTLYTG